MNCPVSFFPRGGRATLLALALWMVGVLCSSTQASRIQLDWDASTSLGVMGYKVYCTSGASAPFSVLDVGNATSATITDLIPGQLYTFSVTAYDLFGVESEPSESAPVWAPAKMLIDWPESKKLGVVGYGLYTGIVGSLATKTVGLATESLVGNLTPGETYFFYPVGYDLMGREIQPYSMIRYTVPLDPAQLSDVLNSTPVIASSTAAYLKADVATLGLWKGTYGSLGWILPGQGVNLPNTAVSSLLATKTWVWEDPSAQSSALKKIESSERIASCYYSANSFTITLALTDAQTYRVSLYFWDAEKSNISQGVLISNADNGKTLSYQTLSNFGKGVYWTYNMKGSVLIRIKRLSGPQAVLSGLFIDPIPSASTPTTALDTSALGLTPTVSIAEDAPAEPTDLGADASVSGLTPQVVDTESSEP